jgi:hypothetical protein
VLIFSWMPDRQMSSVQNMLVKMGLRSLMMLSKKTLVIESTVYEWLNERKWACF